MALEPENDEEAKPAESTAFARTSGAAFVVAADRFLIDSDSPLGDLDSPTAKAYLTHDRDDPDRNLFTLVCTPGMPVRLDVAIQIRNSQPQGVLGVVEWDTVYWPPFERWTIVFVMQRPLGGRLTDILGPEGRLNEYEIPRRLMDPIVAALRALASFSVSHRNVRPWNLFFLDSNRQHLVLGECVTTPPGYDQPPIFEPIERAMAMPAGRGEGDLGDDLYALGVTMIFLLLGGNPVAKLKTEGVIMAKLERGSYGTLCSREKIPISLLEPLRGVLQDDPDERWTLEQMDLWLDGRHKTPMQKTTAKKAEAPFNFAGRDHITRRSLGHAFTRNVADAARHIRDGSLEAWVRRGLKEGEIADAIADVAEAAATHQANAPQGSEHILVTKIASLLDPEGPIRFKGFAFMPDALGPAMAVSIIFKNDVQTPAEVIARNIPSYWIEGRPFYRVHKSFDVRTFAQMRAYLQTNDPGFGIERCLYELNPSVPCQSPLVINECVVNIGDLLPALEEASKTVDAKTKPVDRHIAAFIAAHFEQDITPHLQAIANPRPEQALLGILSLLAFLQWQLRPDPLYGLASWVGGILGPAVNIYHSRATRREIEREMPRLVRQGSLPELFDLIDNAEKRKLDSDGYATAVSQFAAAEAEVQMIEDKHAKKAGEAERTGQQSASMGSVVTGMILVCIIFFTHKW